MTVHPAPLSEAVDALRNRRRTAPAYVDDCCDRIEAVDPEVRALLPEPDRRARLAAAAAALEEQFPTGAERPALYGVPVGVKDIFHADEFPTQAGSQLPAEALTGPEATVVSRLREAGALVLGKTVTTEFAYFEPGPTRNPHDLGHTPGGSSSGSAAAVASGMCPLALGSQTVGSVIRPAAFCGIVGVKPSFGRIPTAGVIPLSESVDHVGMFSQDVAGARLAAAVAYDDWRTVAPTTDPVLGVPTGPYLDQASDEAREAFAEQVDRIAAAGYEVRHVDVLEDIEVINRRHNRLVAADAALAHHEWFEAYERRYAEHTAELVREGRSVTTAERATARAGRGALRRELTDAMDDHGVDLWACPAAPGPAPAGIESTGDPVMNLPWTHAGLPVVSLPAGRAANGLPLGVQVAARFAADERLLAWSERLADAVAPE